ncbi:MAG TPA: efflux RND transporter periplasmic adaptor subunit [Gemmataceae bacterium]|jgi:multidrug resistance efflux pump
MQRFVGPLLGVVVGLMLLAAARADEKAPAAGTVVTRQFGSIVPDKTVRVSPQVGGTVREVLVEVGTAVTAGQVLARLDPAVYELEFKRAVAAVDRARAAAGEAEAQVARGRAAADEADAAVKQAAAQRQYQQQKAARMRELLKNRAVDQQLVDEAEAQAEVSAARLKQAEAQLAAARADPTKERLAVARADVIAAEARRDLAKLRLDGTSVRSPITGTVLARHATAGEAAAPSKGHPTVLFEVADLTHLEAATNIPGPFYNRVSVGATCEVRVDDVPGMTYKGRVIRVAPALSTTDRTAAVRVRIEVPVGDTALRPGMTGSVHIFAK